MELRKSFKFELDLNNRTLTLLKKSAGVARFVYNWSLVRRQELLNTKEGKDKFTNYMQESVKLNAIKGTEFPWMYEVSKYIPQSTLKNLDQAFKNFWEHRHEGVGFPKPKKKNKSRDSFRVCDVKLSGRYIQLPRLGTIRLKEKSTERVKGKILSATVSRSADRWFVSINTVQTIPDPIPVQGPVVGVDLGLKTFATISDGSKFISPKSLKKALAKLRRASKTRTRRKKGSKNRKKAAIREAKIHFRVANVRKDFLHKTTTFMAKTKSVNVIEDLNIAGMMKNHSLARAISDAGWREFRRQLVYKSKWYGSKLVIADRWFASSKICHRCGFKLDKLPLHVREWDCPNCLAHHDRDFNASKNLENLTYPGIQGNVTGSSDPVKKPVEIPPAAELKKFKSTSRGSKKQEVINSSCNA